MYIRRKVYSAVEDENGEIRYFSTNEIVSENDYIEALYSEDYLDDDDLDRLYSDSEDGMSAGKKAAIIGGSTAAGIGLAILGHKGGKKLSANVAKKLANGYEVGRGQKALATLFEKEQGLVSKAEAKGKAAAAQTKRWLDGKFKNVGDVLKAKKAGILSEAEAEKLKKQMEKEAKAKAVAEAKAAQDAAAAKVEAKAQAAADKVRNAEAHAQTMAGIPHRDRTGRFARRPRA